MLNNNKKQETLFFGTKCGNANSIAAGYATETTNYGEIATGILNKSTKGDNPNSPEGIVGDPKATLFSVGCGTKGERKNALEVKGDGSVIISGKDGSDVNIADLAEKGAIEELNVKKLDKPEVGGIKGQVLSLDENGNTIWKNEEGGGALGGFKYADSIDQIPSTPPASEENIGYVVGTHFYVFVGTGGDVKGGKWKDVGEFRGPKGEQGPQGPQGPQGNTGSSIAYPFELVNNLTDGGAEKALSAQMGKELGELISLCGSGKIKGLYDDFPDSIYVTDEEGYVFLKIDKEGLNYVDKGEYPIEGEDGNLVVAKEGKMKSIGMKGHPWFGKNVYCFGDSLMEGWRIQPKLMELTGCKCNKNLNSLVAAGGTWLGSIGGDRGGSQRAQNFVNIDESVYGTKDILLLESVFGGADVSEDELIDYPPYMFTQYKDYGARTFSSNSEVESFFSSNFSTAISIFDTPKAFSIIRFLLGAVGKKISISGTATANGNVTLTINGYTMSSSVTKGMTSAQIAQKIYEWGFSTYTAWDKLSISSNVITLSYIGGHGGSATDTFSFDGSSVGVTASIADTGTTARYAYMFKSNDVSNWNTPSCWSRVSENSDYPNVWKGVIEHIIKNCPQTKIYMCLFPSYKFMESYVRPDGTFDTEAFKRANNSKSRRALQTALANYYNLPIIDVEKEMNVMNNWHEFYPENNVHPLQSMNDRWAEIIAKHA